MQVSRDQYILKKINDADRMQWPIKFIIGHVYIIFNISIQ